MHALYLFLKIAVLVLTAFQQSVGNEILLHTTSHILIFNNEMIDVNSF